MIAPLRRRHRWLAPGAFGVAAVGLVLGVMGGFDELFTPLLNQLGHISRHIFKGIFGGIARIIPDPGFSGQQIDNTGEIIFFTDGQYHHQRIGTQHILIRPPQTRYRQS